MESGRAEAQLEVLKLKKKTKATNKSWENQKSVARFFVAETELAFVDTVIVKAIIIPSV